MVSKILRGLARAGVLASHRGATGGYSLQRSPSGLSVAEVIRAIEGPISLVQCGSEPGLCDQEHCCPTRISWARINHEVEKALERVPLMELVVTGPEPPVQVGEAELGDEQPRTESA
jgi:Rrf2 family protein